jgi:hypothetical protein
MIYGTSLDEAQPNYLSITEDIGSHSNYTLTSTRHAALTMWLWWTSLSPCGVKLNMPKTRHHSPLGSKKTLGKKGVGSTWPR